DSRNQGLEYMRFLRKSKCIACSRKKVYYLSKSFWKNNRMSMRKPTHLCNIKDTCKGWKVKKGRWSFINDDDDDTNLCEYCRWDYELEFFYQLFNIS
ncbi:hypothetical protein RYX36_026690, partial [Vicia faba]